MSPRQRKRKEFDPDVEFTPFQFTLLEKGCELYEAAALSVNNTLDALGIPTLFLSSRRALIQAGVLALKNRVEGTKLAPSTMTFRQREAIRWAMLYYQAKLEGVAKTEQKLLVETDDSVDKQNELDVINEMLGAQMTLRPLTQVILETEDPEGNPDGQTVRINDGPAISLHDVDAVSQALRAAMEKDLADAEKDGQADLELAEEE